MGICAGCAVRVHMRRPGTHVWWDVTRVPTSLGAALENLTQAHKASLTPANRIKLQSPASKMEVGVVKGPTWMVPCHLPSASGGTDELSLVHFPLIQIPKQLRGEHTPPPPSSPSPQPSAQASSQCPGVMSHLPSWKHPITLQQ